MERTVKASFGMSASCHSVIETYTILIRKVLRLTGIAPSSNGLQAWELTFGHDLSPMPPKYLLLWSLMPILSPDVA